MGDSICAGGNGCDFLDDVGDVIMKLKVIRNEFTNESTIGELWVDGKFFCFTLEDKDRDLLQTQPLTEIAQRKLFGRTAIPYGTYGVAMTYSGRFKRYMPQILDVPGFSGIRIHTGNSAASTDGCLLVGETKDVDFIGSSRVAYNHLLERIKAIEQSEKISIEIVKG